MEETYYLLTGIQYSSRPCHHWETSGKRPEAPLLGDDIVFQTLMRLTTSSSAHCNEDKQNYQVT